MPQNSILISGRDILVNGKKTQIRSGAMHYFRIHPDYWRDRIVKLRQCGLNTLETYLCWNLTNHAKAVSISPDGLIS